MAEEFNAQDFESFKNQDQVFDPKEFEDFKSVPVTAGGLAKSLGTGAAQSAIDIAGSLGDVRNFAGNVAEKAGLPKGVAQGALGAIPIVGPVINTLGQIMPTSKTIGEAVGTDKLHHPQNVPEEYAHTIGEFLPTAIGPGGLVRKGVEAVGGALGSETAGQLARQYAPGLEPVARVAGSLVSSIPSVVKGRPRTYPDEQELKTSAQHFYQHPVVAGVEIKPAALDNLADGITNTMNRAQLRDKTAPQTFRTVDAIRETAGQPGRIADLDASRQVLGDIRAANPGSPEARAAGIAIGKIDDFLKNMRQPDLISGNAQRAAELMGHAREDYAAYKRLQRVNRQEYHGQLNADAHHSGTNLDNATRSRMKSILVSEKKSHGYSDEELMLMERVVTGTLPQNLMRKVAKIFSPTGMMGMLGLHGAVALMTATGNPMGFAAPVAGGLARLAENAMSRHSVANLQDAVAMRSRLGKMTPGRVPSEMPETAAAALMRSIIASRHREGTQ